MRALVKLFGRSPFAPLRAHMDKVAACVKELVPLFEAVKAEDREEVSKISKKICKLEHEADVTKNAIRADLKSSLFLPVARLGLLKILTIQDCIADKAEDIAVILTFRDPKIPPALTHLLFDFLQSNLKAFEAAFDVIAELHELLESGFGGIEAEKVREQVHQVAYLEHEVDLLQREIAKILFNNEQSMNCAEFYLWMKVIEETAHLSDLSENLANSVLTTMEMK
ncbi:MAG: TIGR00153 family protein [Verrucomicrobia bacterium]|nr:TIGR00153 family protein [Verrucomicrobiota bacterium]